MRNAVLVLGVIVGCLAADTSEACNRRGCGRRGTHCVYYKRVVAPYVAKQAVAYQVPTQNIILQNNYPAALSSPIAVQGSTIFGYDAASQPYRVNVEELINKQFQLAQNLQNLSAKTSSQITSTLALQIAGQTEVEKIRAATAHLKAANVGASSQSITIKQQGAQTSVTAQRQVAEPQEPAAPVDPNAPPQEPTPWVPEGDVPAALSRCAECHAGATPKKNFSVDRDWSNPKDWLICDQVTESLRRMASTDPDYMMPPPKSGPPLTQQEKGEIMQFFLSHDLSRLPKEEIQ